MGIVFALLAALGYGTGDFCAGLASRSYRAEPISGMALAIELVLSAAALLVVPGHGPSPHAIAWGAISGLGSGLGTLALYRGFATASLTVVATLSAVLAAVGPVIVGLALGDHLAATAAIGIVVAVPAIVLVSFQPSAPGARGARAGVLYGLAAGASFALLFVALDRAGTRAGAWPLLPGQAVGLCVVAPFALRAMRRAGRPAAPDLLLVLASGVLAGLAALLFLVSTGRGELSIVAVVTSLYPAFTVLLARTVLSERWTRSQAAGLGVAAASIVLVSLR